MPIIHIRFPGGRYHATPGGHHVNEGQIEWPPSPWRLLRAFIATGYTKLGWETFPAHAADLFARLAEVLPTYHLPPATSAHSRHYMPLGPLDKGRDKTTLVFDTWADVGDSVLAIDWPAELSDEASTLLAKLCDNLSYLGRSESWASASLEADGAIPAGTRPCRPCIDGAAPPPDHEQIAITAPLTPTAFTAWRTPLVDEALAPFPLPEKKKPGKKLLTDRAKATAPFPSDLLDALQWDTATWKKHRWGQPPGSRRVLYARDRNALGVGCPPPHRRFHSEPVQVMLLALATDSRNASALPTIVRSLPQAELIHQALLSRAGHGNAIDCPELTGKDADGQPLRGHRHAYILPVDLDGDGYLDHVLIHTHKDHGLGLGPLAQHAIRSLRRTWQKKGQDIQVALVGAGDLEQLRQLPAPLDQGVKRLLGAAQGSCSWRSATPFVPPRYLKKSGPNELSAQVRRELDHHGFPPANVQVQAWDAQNARLRHAVRVRKNSSKAPPIDCGYALELTFDHPINGPIALGYASHFGLGRMEAIT